MTNEEIIKDIKKNIEESCGKIKYDFNSDFEEEYLEKIRKLLYEKGYEVTSINRDENGHLISIDAAKKVFIIDINVEKT